MIVHVFASPSYKVANPAVAIPPVIAGSVTGVDIVLGPQNFVQAFDAVIDAVEKGIITEERLNQSVRRILMLKKQR